MKYLRGYISVLLVIFPVIAFSQELPPSNQIDALPTQPVPIADINSKIITDTTVQQHREVSLGPETQPIYPSLKMTGFSDFNFLATDQEDFKSGFVAGQFVLHFASALSSRVSFFGEVALGGQAEVGVQNLEHGMQAEVERYILRFDQSDYFKVSFGRYHTQINWWNTAFHHGLWLQTTISRPEMIMFHGGFIPAHFTGGLFEGSIPAGGLNLGYDLGVGNGRGTELHDPGDLGDINNNRAWLINLFSKPDALLGLQVGGSLYNDKITLSDGREFREWIISGHTVWSQEKPEVIAEIANVSHRDLVTDGTSNNLAFYIQVAYRLPWFEEKLKPYYRFEYIDISSADTVFGSISGLRSYLIGIRFDFSDFATLKGEYRYQERPNQANVHGIFFQTSFTF